MHTAHCQWGGTVHAGSANLIVHIYIESNLVPKRDENATFLVDESNIESLMREEGANLDVIEGYLFPILF